MAKTNYRKKTKKELAKIIATDLMTKHTGELCERLARIDDSSKKDFGGWSYRCLELRIYILLSSQIADAMNDLDRYERENVRLLITIEAQKIAFAALQEECESLRQRLVQLWRDCE